MRRFTIEGRDYKLTEKQHEQLLQRFDVRKAEDCYGDKIIRVSCICPEGSLRNCRVCSIGPRHFNCLSLLLAITGWHIPDGLSLNAAWVFWSRASKRVEEYITKVRDYLLAIPKTT